MDAKEAYAQLKELAAGRYCSLSVEVCGGGKVEEHTTFQAFIAREQGGFLVKGKTFDAALALLDLRLKESGPSVGPDHGIDAMDEFKEVLK